MKTKSPTDTVDPLVEVALDELVFLLLSAHLDLVVGNGKQQYSYLAEGEVNVRKDESCIDIKHADGSVRITIERIDL